MPQPQLYSTAQAVLGGAKEVTRGTAVAASFYVPMDTPQLTPDQTYLMDAGLRGSPVTTYDIVMGVRNDTMEFKGDVHLDTFPNLLVAALGTDTKTATAAPFTHTITLLNSPSTGSQPPSYTWSYFNGYNCQQIAGAQLASLEIDFTATDSVKFSTKFIGQPFTVVSAPTQSYSAVDKIIPAWNNSMTIATVANTILIDGSVTIDRATEAVQTGDGTQGPVSVFAGPCKVTGKCTFLVISTEAIMNAALGTTGTPQELKFTFTDPSSTHSMLLQMTDAQFMNPKYDASGIYLKVSVDFEAESNTTDATTGYAPIRAVVLNAASTAY